MTRVTILLTTWLFMMPFACLGQSQIVVVVSERSKITELTHKQLVDLYMGKYMAFPNGELAMTLDYEKDNQLRTRFFQALTGRPISRINAYWSKVSFSGKASPPSALPSISAILEKVTNTPNAIAYIPVESLTQDVKVVYRIGQ